MCGSAFWMTSPSISSTRRSTPWAAGCCGPKFNVKFWISGIARVLQLRLVASVVTDDLRHERSLHDAHRLVYDTALVGVVTHLDVADQREVFAERMADEAVVRQDPAQIRMALEENAEEIERLALVPVGGRPDHAHRIEQRP